VFLVGKLKGVGRKTQRGWPRYMLGGHVRTSTVVLIVAFMGLWWVYDGYQHSGQSSPTPTPTPQVVPPGFIPDPDYTWVPRSRLQEPPPTRTWTPTTTSTTMTTTTTTTTMTTNMTTTTSTPPPFPPIVLPPPFGPPPPAPPPPGG